VCHVNTGKAQHSADDGPMNVATAPNKAAASTIVRSTTFVPPIK
jgi:hypothetical protein